MGAAEILPASSLDADAFLRHMADGEPITFQTFDDTGAKQRELSRVLHGSLAEHAVLLASLNVRGAGVFWMVNAGDGIRRASANVRRVRALFVDLDGAPLEPVRVATLPAHCIVESSPGRWHAYWRVGDCRLEDFTRLQRMLATRFAADPKVCDLPRVMRLPGFDHRKGKPHRSQIITLCDHRPYAVAELVEGLDLSPLKLADSERPNNAQVPRRSLSSAIPEGERNKTLFSLAVGLVRRGYDARAVNTRLQRINAERCVPPLCATEVDAICAQAASYGSDGFAMLPHALLDSAEWRALPPPAHTIVVTAYRRYDGGNDGNIAVTWSDFEGLPGFRKKGTFYKYRALVIASGILVRSQEGRNGQSGRKPDLFAIAPRFLPVPQKGTLPQYQESTPLHR